MKDNLVERIIAWVPNRDSSYSVMYATPNPGDRFILQLASDFPIEYAEEIRECYPGDDLFIFYKKFGSEDEFVSALNSKQGGKEVKTLLVDSRGDAVKDLIKRVVMFEKNLIREKNIAFLKRASRSMNEKFILMAPVYHKNSRN